jgi:hypothetical protein
MKLTWKEGIVIGLFFIVMSMIYIRRTSPETYTPATLPSTIASQALEDISTGKVKAGPRSVLGISPVSSGAYEKQGRLWRPFTYFAGIQIRPRYTLKNNVIVIGKTISLEGEGRSLLEAKNQAIYQANDAIKEIQKTLSAANLLA